MKKFFLPVLLLLFTGCAQAHPSRSGQAAAYAPQPGQGCTVFYAAGGGQALAGNNEDSYDPLTRVWFIPASEGRHGRVYFGYDDMQPQGGLNDEGLFFDALSLPPKPSILSSRMPDFPGGTVGMMDEAMSKSSTVDEAAAFYERYSRPGMEAGEIFFGDRTGQSAVIEGDAIIRKRGAYQVATNFRLSEFPDPPYPCSRANTVDERLSQAAGNYSVELFRQLLDDVHQEKGVQTLYSQVYDLKKGLIYFYHFHDFQHAVVWNLADELAKGPRMASVASLFPENQEYERYAAEKLDEWKYLFDYKIDKKVKPADLAGLAGDYRTQGEAEAPTARIYLEKDQLYIQYPDKLPMELYPASADSVFHRTYNNMELDLSFRRNWIGEATGAQANLAAYDGKIISSFTLEKSGVITNDQLILPALAIILVILAAIVLVIRRRRAVQGT